MEAYFLICNPGARHAMVTGTPLTLREESRLRVFENRILRRIFGPKAG